MKTVLVTGASRGFGRAWAEKLLANGYNVVATSRKIESLKELTEKYGNAVLPLQVDINQRNEAFAAVDKAIAHFGAIDVLINNAGYALFGPVEEASETQAREQFETNFFGTLWMTQAVLPYMRHQRHGHIIQVSSILGLATVPLLGMYSAAKFAVEGLSETLKTEVAAFGINVTLLEPNGYHSDIWNTGINTVNKPEYNPLRKAVAERNTSDSFGQVQATADAVLKLIESPNPPLRLLLGKVAMPFVKHAYDERIKTWQEWNDVSIAAH